MKVPQESKMMYRLNTNEMFSTRFKAVKIVHSHSTRTICMKIGLNNFYIYLFLCEKDCACAIVWMWRSKGNFSDDSFFFLPDEFRGIRVSVKSLYLPSCFISTQ